MITEYVAILYYLRRLKQQLKLKYPTVYNYNNIYRY